MNNPASRLLSILTRAYEQDPESKTHEALAIAFGMLTVQPITDLIKNIAKIVELTDKTSEIINNTDNINSNNYLLWTDTVNRFIRMIQLEAQWNSIRTYINPEKLISLQFTADFLSMASTENEIDSDQLFKVIQDFTNLKDELDSIDLPDELLNMLHIQIDEMILSLQEYHMSGVEGLERALTQMVGYIVISKNLFPVDDSISPLRKIAGLTINLFNILKVSKSFIAIANDTVQVLENLSDTVEN